MNTYIPKGMEKFIPDCNKSILYRMENEGKPEQNIGTFEDYLKLPLPDCYIKRLEAESKKSNDNSKDASGEPNNN